MAAFHREQYQDGLELLLVAAGCVLLIACANLTNLLLARGRKNLRGGWRRRAMASQLFGVKPYNPLMLATAILLLGVAALVAALIPAQKAASVDPMNALRTE